MKICIYFLCLHKFKKCIIHKFYFVHVDLTMFCLMQEQHEEISERLKDLTVTGSSDAASSHLNSTSDSAHMSSRLAGTSAMLTDQAAASSLPTYSQHHDFSPPGGNLLQYITKLNF